MTDPHTFEHRKALLQLSELLSDDDSKKIVYVEGLPRMLEEKSPWEVLVQLEVRGKTTVDELTRILKAINRHDAAKKAKELIGKPHRRKKGPGYKALMLEDSLVLAVKHCKILVDQVDYLKFAANKDGNKRIEEMASEAMGNLTNHVQLKLRYALAYFNSQNESSAGYSSSSPSSSPESSRSPEWPSAPIHSNPHPTHMCIKDTESKRVAEKRKQSTLHVLTARKVNFIIFTKYHRKSTKGDSSYWHWYSNSQSCHSASKLDQGCTEGQCQYFSSSKRESLHLTSSNDSYKFTR